VFSRCGLDVPLAEVFFSPKSSTNHSKGDQTNKPHFRSQKHPINPQQNDPLDRVVLYCILQIRYCSGKGGYTVEALMSDTEAMKVSGIDKKNPQRNLNPMSVWVKMRAPAILRSKDYRKIRKFIEWARDQKAERAIRVIDLADCLAQHYGSFGRGSAIGAIEGAERWSFRLVCSVYNEMPIHRRALVSEILGSPPETLTLPLLEALCAAGFEVQEKDHKNLMTHLAAFETQWRSRSLTIALPAHQLSDTWHLTDEGSEVIYFIPKSTEQWARYLLRGPLRKWVAFRIEKSRRRLAVAQARAKAEIQQQSNS